MAAQDEDEDDYMSDVFLPTEVAKDTRPGLLMTHEQQRLHDQQKRRKECELLNRTASIKVLEQQRRQEGLEKAIDSSNKGFALLQKMGYEPGSGIGKNNSGRVEPIGIVLKTDRKGLGRDAVLKEIRKLKISMIRSRSAGPSIGEYRERRAHEAAEKLNRLDLFKCQRVCRQMDLEQDIQEPSEQFFWPEVLVEDDADDESIKEPEEQEQDNMSITEQLELLLIYLRRTYNYCIYCGTVYNDKQDLEGECPGPNRQDH